MYSNKFFQNEVSEANEKFLNASGDWNNAFGEFDADGDEFEGADDEFEGADDYESLQMANAGGRRPASAPESQPYIISVANTTSSNVSDVEILKALSRQFAATTSGLSYSYNVGTMTYPEFLAWIASGNVFSIGQTSLVGIGSNASTATAQVQETLTVVTSDPNGNEVTRRFNPRIDSFQYSGSQTDLWIDFLVNSFTSFKIGTVYANTTLKLYLYPKQKLNQFKALKQKANVTKYGNPKTSIYASKSTPRLR